jgi:hypothetical protein
MKATQARSCAGDSHGLSPAGERRGRGISHLSAGLFTLIIRDPVSPNPITTLTDRHRAPLRQRDDRSLHPRKTRSAHPGQGFSRVAHSAYKPNGMTDQAADFVVAAISGAY